MLSLLVRTNNYVQAAEALGAIGSTDSTPILEKYCQDPVPEVAETCQVAVDSTDNDVKVRNCSPSPGIRWTQEHRDALCQDGLPYASVDPAPPEDASLSVEALRAQLLDTNTSTFKRYKALFALRNKGGNEAALAIADALNDSSALFRHEVAYVLGQMQCDAAEVLHKLEEVSFKMFMISWTLFRRYGTTGLSTYTSTEKREKYREML